MQRLLAKWFRLATLCLAFCAGAGVAHADTLTLAWDRNSEPEVNGYVVYIGNAPGAYSQQIDVGNAATELAARMAKGVPQANGEIAIEPLMDVNIVGQSILYMANLPLEANVLFHTVMATKMPFVGRG